MGAARIAATQLVADNVGVLGVSLFRGSQLPPSPDACVVLSEYGGRPPMRLMGDQTPTYDYPSVQASSRDNDPDAAEAKAWAVYASLTKVVNATVGGQRVLAIEPKQVPFFLRVDDQNRTIWVCNYEVQREGATS